MTSSSTIIGITRQHPDRADISSVIGKSDEDISSPFGSPDLTGEALLIEPLQSYDGYGEDEGYHSEKKWKSMLVPGILLMAFAAWTGYFGWTHQAENFAAIGADRITILIANWAIPTLLIAVAWLIFMRSSQAEATRFGDVATLLRNESIALELRMRTVNEEISMAREFLSQNARELESVGRHSASKLMEAAQQLNIALADSDAKAKTLEAVSNAAATNLEQLRKHLPVVTSAAKDVTNQIGSAGNSAQLQVKTLIAGLQRVADAGANARENIEGLEVRAGEAAIQLSHIISQNAQALETSVSEASERTRDITKSLTKAQVDIATGLGNATEDINALADVNLAKLTQQVELLRNSLSALSVQSNSEDNRITSMIDRISSHIDDRVEVLADLDIASADRVVKLAFAVEALVTSTNALNESLTESGLNTDTLSQQSQKLLLALSDAKNDLEVVVPDAFSRTDRKLAESLSQIKNVADSALSLDGFSDDLLIKLTTIQNLISSQDKAVNSLIGASDLQFSAHQEQTDTLAAALVQTRAMMEDLAEAANEGLVKALHEVRDSTKEAAEVSRLILDEEMSNVAERLSRQSREALSSAIDDQVTALNEIVQKSFDKNILLSQKATQQIIGQLSDIDAMTSSLEARIETAQGGFSGLDDDSFARQMVLLTESLNSTAIDVAKILSNEVTDTSWAAYLKGDRGVFTRRAVKLLDAGEAKAIATHYGDDAEFREHVNRYIHDFETMMRVLLSTRDGNAIGVTLLSSDVGKLYVALAQAIERLRN
jgi:hypothetical protein